jgi:hypothetical protein
MRLEKQEDGFKLKQMPLERGLHVGEWDSACYSWLDFWAWKYDYSLFYVEHEGVYRSFASAEFPNGIRGGLYLFIRRLSISLVGARVVGPRSCRSC